MTWIPCDDVTIERNEKKQIRITLTKVPTKIYFKDPIDVKKKIIESIGNEWISREEVTKRCRIYGAIFSIAVRDLENEKKLISKKEKAKTKPITYYSKP